MPANQEAPGPRPQAPGPRPRPQAPGLRPQAPGPRPQHAHADAVGIEPRPGASGASEQGLVTTRLLDGKSGRHRQNSSGGPGQDSKMNSEDASSLFIFGGILVLGSPRGKIKQFCEGI